MSLLSGAWYLFKTEVKRWPLGAIIWFGISLWTLWLCSPIYADLFSINHPMRVDILSDRSDEYSSYYGILPDYMFMLTFGVVGVMVTFVFGGGMKNDILADRLAYYRSLPIRTEHIVLSKVLAGIVGTFVMLLFFFLANIAGFLVFSDFELSQITITYLIHAVLLYSFMMITNNLFAWIDLSVSYKAYTILSFVYVILMLVIPIILSVVFDGYQSLIISAYNYSEQQPLKAIALSIIVFVLSNLIGYKATVRSLSKRNLG